MVNYIAPDLVFDDVPSGKVGWQSPSNIALVKYWGKRDIQIPANPSISFTLSQSCTNTYIEFTPSSSSNFKVDFIFEGINNETFAKKTKIFFDKLLEIFPFIKQLDFVISSKNTFPHSAGIASSASGMSAIALGLCEIEKQFFNSFTSHDEFLKKASYVARLGSGSACRSIYGGIVSWGNIDGMLNTSNLFGSEIKIDVNPVFNTFNDTILIVDSQQKKVSSTIGHGLMNSNPFSEKRFLQANNNIDELLKIIKVGDMGRLIQIVESEALTLHAMMMTSKPYFLLMKPNTISIIDMIWQFREDTKIPICFTLDAGPNVHLLYPDAHKQKVDDFINTSLLTLTANNTAIFDRVGSGPKLIK